MASALGKLVLVVVSLLAFWNAASALLQAQPKLAEFPSLTDIPALLVALFATVKKTGRPLIAALCAVSLLYSLTLYFVSDSFVPVIPGLYSVDRTWMWKYLVMVPVLLEIVIFAVAGIVSKPSNGTE